MPKIPLPTSIAFVVGIAAGAAAFVVLTVTGHAPEVSRASIDLRHDDPPSSVEKAQPDEPPPAPLRRDGALGTAANDLGTAARRHDPPRQTPVEADVRPVGDRTSAMASAPPPAPVPPREELQQPRSEASALEQQLAAARADAHLRLQRELNEQVVAIRSLLAEEQARKDAEATAAREAMARMGAAVNTLQVAQGRLITGDGDVLGELSEASAALPDPAQRAVELARSAIASEDLYRARFWLRVAVAETQHVQLGH